MKDPDVKARLLGQRAPPDAATGLKPDAARVRLRIAGWSSKDTCMDAVACHRGCCVIFCQAGFQAPADVGGNPSAPANEVAARQPEGSSALMGDAPGGFALEGVSDEPSGPSAPEQVSSGLPGEAPALSAEGASMQIDQEAPEDSMPPPRLHRADPAALGSDVPMEVEGNIPVVQERVM